MGVLGAEPEATFQTETQPLSSVLRCSCHKPHKQTPKEENKNWFVYYTIVSSSPGKNFSFIGHSENMGSTAGHLNELVTKQGLHYLGLRTKTVSSMK